MAAIDVNRHSSISENDIESDAYNCLICLEILENPMRIPCGSNHIYCCTCLAPYKELAEPHCPQCRAIFDPQDIQRASDIEKKLRNEKSKCKWCQDEMQLSKMRCHVSKCRKVDRSLPKFKPVKKSSQHIPCDVANRSTFMCPVCGQKNFDCVGLVTHCNDNHPDKKTRVVCPICASMPWGDSNLPSSNFLQHLNLRHKFEYDTFVDYSVDDDQMLKLAIQNSVEEH